MSVLESPVGPPNVVGRGLVNVLDHAIPHAKAIHEASLYRPLKWNVDGTTGMSAVSERRTENRRIEILGNPNIGTRTVTGA